MEVPDELSIMTYVSTLYYHLSNLSNSEDKTKTGSKKEKPRRYLFDILADEEYKRRYKIKQGEINEDDNFA